LEYDGTAGSGGGIDCYKQFADAENTQPVQILQRDSLLTNHNVEVCYKAIIALQLVRMKTT
jgi:hypothetical protein